MRRDSSSSGGGGGGGGSIGVRISSSSSNSKPAEEKMARAKKKIECGDCNKTFSRKSELQQHRREEHSRRNVCPVCKRTFESEKRLKMHSQFHNVGGEYKCFYCSKRFNKAWKMKIHLVNHSGRPSYICEYCGDDFLYPGKIVSHLKQAHDVCYACKECGMAIPIEQSQRPHKCRIYGCKDCLMSFESEEELASHTKAHTGQEKHVSSFQVLLMQSPEQQVCGGCHDSGGVDELKDVDIGGGGGGGNNDINGSPSSNEGLECGEVKYPLVVKDSHGGCDSGSGAVKVNHLNGTASNMCGARGTSHRSSPGHDLRTLVDDEPPGARITDMEGEDRMPWGSSAGSGTPSNPPYTCTVPEGSSRDGDRGGLALSARGSAMPNNTAVIKGDEEREEEESHPPSYFSILLRSPHNAQGSKFKVPETSMATLRKSDLVRKSLRRKQEEINRAVQKKEELLNTLQFYVDTDARLTQRSQNSFESWLTGDSFSAADHDYVFGFEASVSVGSRREEAHYHYFNKKIPKKEKVDMTFEDLCLF